MTLGENIKSWRNSKNMKQEDLALVLNTTLQTISHWETNYSEPSIEYLIKLADYFDTTIDELVGRTM